MLSVLMWLTALAIITFMVWNYFRIRQAATYLTNDEFKKRMVGGQLIDIRSPELFRQKHILGARNFQMAQSSVSLSALRKDKPVLLYENTRGAQIGRAVLALKKAGFTEVYVLRDGFDHWDGKTK
jgi:rhodanese-related sulfurtransferase